MEHNPALDSLTDRQLVNTLTTLAALERSATAKLLAALGEFDHRRLFLPLGFTSMFAYCTNRLGFSQDEAFFRIEAARICRRFPSVLAYLEKGAITLTTARLLAAHLTVENQVTLLDAASFQKRPEVDALVARLRPKPDVPSTLRKLPDLHRTVDSHTSAHVPEPHAAAAGIPARMLSARQRGTDDWQTVFDAASAAAPASAATPSSAAASLALTQPIRARRPIVAPLSAASYRLQVTISKVSHDRLRELQARVRHVIPDGDAARIVERSLEVLLEQIRKKDGFVARPRPVPARSRGGRHIPAAVKREVWKRDSGCCAFQAPDGTRCDEHARLEYHHVRPYARGGPASVENIELRCRAHNSYESELIFGARR